tara:strand:- start:309 stop:482 length:174 start_codon:yes stop_codon:yes gene_type:complete
MGSMMTVMALSITASPMNAAHVALLRPSPAPHAAFVVKDSGLVTPLEKGLSVKVILD